MVRKALGLMEMGPREATQGELQGELLYNTWSAGMSRPVKTSQFLCAVVELLLDYILSQNYPRDRTQTGLKEEKTQKRTRQDLDKTQT